MFRIGEFSQIAQVSGHLLRHYDDIGLLKPAHVDQWTNYRYYSATQLADLNKIMALKDLGFSLEEIGGVLSDNISSDEMRSMLMSKKAGIQEMIQAEIARLHRVEARLGQLEDNPSQDSIDIAVKHIPSQPYLATDCQMRFLDDGPNIVRKITQLVESTLKAKQLRYFTAIFQHDDFRDEHVDLEAGFVLSKPTKKELALAIEDIGTLALRELPEVTEMATLVQHEEHHILFHAYEAVGNWLEENRYQLNGPIRKLYLTPPDPDNRDRALVELQFPITSVSPAASRAPQ